MLHTWSPPLAYGCWAVRIRQADIDVLGSLGCEGDDELWRQGLACWQLLQDMQSRASLIVFNLFGDEQLPAKRPLPKVWLLNCRALSLLRPDLLTVALLPLSI